MKFVTIGPVVSEEKSFEIVDGGTTEPAYTLNSLEAFGSGEGRLLLASRIILFAYPANLENYI